LTTAVLAFWNCAHGISSSHTALQLGVSDKTVTKYYRRAMEVMSWDIIRKQNELQFGCLDGGLTADVEADESSFGHWQDGEVHYWYPWIGIAQRGSTKLWLRPIGITESHGEARVPPLDTETWHQTARTVFSPSSGVVLMTDGAQAYKDIGVPGIVHHESVNHSEKEFARSVSVPRSTQAAGERPAMAGTQLIDRIWGIIKSQIPHGLSIRRHDGVVDTQWVDLYVRAAQWRLEASTFNRWEAFCAAVKEWALERGGAAEASAGLALQLPSTLLNQAVVDGSPSADVPVASPGDALAAADAASASASLGPCGSFSCSACGRQGCEPSLTSCPYHGKARLGHADAQFGDTVPHIHEVSVRSVDETTLEIAGEPFSFGVAGSQHNNCLLFSLRQLICEPEVDVELARLHLQVVFSKGPAKVTKDNFLEFGAHCMDALSFLLWHTGQCSLHDISSIHERYSVTCIDMLPDGTARHGAAVGARRSEAAVVFFVGRVNGNHFFPLVPAESRA